MTAIEAVRAGLVAALQEHAPLREAVNGIYHGEIKRATPPYVTVAEPLAVDWSTKTEAGRELRLFVQVHEEPERSERLDRLSGEVEAAIERMGRDLDGWRVASLVFLRAHTMRGEGPWVAAIEYRARVLEA